MPTPRRRLALAVALAVSGCSVPVAPPDRQDVAALIDDHVVTWEDVDGALKNVPGVTPDLRRSMLRLLVEREVLLQAARREGIAVGEKELEEALRDHAWLLGGEADYARWLRLRGITAVEHREERRGAMLAEKLRVRLDVGPKGLRAELLRGVRVEPADLFEED